MKSIELYSRHRPENRRPPGGAGPVRRCLLLHRQTWRGDPRKPGKGHRPTFRDKEYSLDESKSPLPPWIL
ncbi:hypothetical protein AOXY_G4544 [Acipenser oxyrinchus oxyrinchus]|uniref:Uncharacterized protein n=1 Tax=Acipenser oxyrinchus oxyrinchus TaxID=40147 RepID=A0AAD8LR31_ACIOX|nr:hypothetical protein AOXY_G4544 [Acipenser oxyrinchus oxyrinchus]